jgi:acyl-CoA synthetase (AMP-forming)/AMP-acid ligase II
MHVAVLLDMAAEGFADRVVIGRRDGGISARELRSRSAAAAAQICAAGADSVLYLGVNGPAFPIALFGAALAGVPLVPVNYRLGESQLGALLANHPKAFGIADDGAAAQALGRGGIKSRTKAQFLERLSEAPQVDPHSRDNGVPAVVIYTSGTTSVPKGVLLRHENLTSYVLGTVEYGSAAPADASLVTVPPYHIAAVASVLTNLYAGRRVVVLEHFAPQSWIDMVESESITNALVVPTMLGRILQVGEGRELPSLRSLAYGGAPMPMKTVERALRAWPHVDFVNAYGLTETSSTISVLGPDDHRAALVNADPTARARLGSVGKVLPTIEVEIRGPGGELAQPGETGRIFVRGDQVSAEYAGSGKNLDDDGFFDTRDDGFLDVDRYLFISGRADDTIIRGAENIAPAEIEEILLEHPAVADAVVVGVPDDDWGQRIEAAVVVSEGIVVDVDDLKDHVRTQLRGSKTPDNIVFWDELPRTETGKVVRRDALARLLLEKAYPND